MKRKLKKYLTVVLVLSLTLCNVNNSNAASKVSITKKINVKKGKTAKITLKKNKLMVKWSVIKGKKLVKISKGTKTGIKVKGIKKGTAKVQAKIGKKKYICTVKVINNSKPKKTTKPTKKPTVKNTKNLLRLYIRKILINLKLLSDLQVK